MGLFSDNARQIKETNQVKKVIYNAIKKERMQLQKITVKHASLKVIYIIKYYLYVLCNMHIKKLRIL